MTKESIHRLAEVAHQVNGLTPLVWLAWLTIRKRRPGLEVWLLSSAFTVAWVADSVSHWTGYAFVGVIYPLTQALFVGTVLLDRKEVRIMGAILTAVAVLALAWKGVDPFNPLLQVAAWGAITGIVWEYKALGRLRLCLLETFGLGLVAWLVFLIAAGRCAIPENCPPAFWTWLAYQVTRFIGAILFCWAATSPMPKLRLTKT